MGQTLEIMIYREGIYNGLPRLKLISFLEYLVEKSLVSLDTNASVLLPLFNQYPNNKPITIATLIFKLDKSAVEIIPCCGIDFGCDFINDGLLMELKCPTDSPDCLEEWGIGIRTQQFYRWNGIEHILLNTDMAIYFDFHLSEMIWHEWLKEVPGRPRIRSFINGLANLLETKINVDVSVV